MKYKLVSENIPLFMYLTSAKSAGEKDKEIVSFNGKCQEVCNTKEFEEEYYAEYNNSDENANRSMERLILLSILLRCR